MNSLLADPSFHGCTEPREPYPFFVMQVFFDGFQSLTEKQKVALVDHELCHFDYTEEGTPIIVPHDIEEFNAVVKRHGVWDGRVQAFTDALASRLIED